MLALVVVVSRSFECHVCLQLWWCWIKYLDLFHVYLALCIHTSYKRVISRKFHLTLFFITITLFHQLYSSGTWMIFFFFLFFCLFYATFLVKMITLTHKKKYFPFKILFFLLISSYRSSSLTTRILNWGSRRQIAKERYSQVFCYILKRLYFHCWIIFHFLEHYRENFSS